MHRWAESTIPVLIGASRPSDGQLGLIALFALGIPASIALLWVISTVTQRRRGLRDDEYGPVKWLFCSLRERRPTS